MVSHDMVSHDKHMSGISQSRPSAQLEGCRTAACAFNVVEEVPNPGSGINNKLLDDLPAQGSGGAVGIR